MRLFFWLAVVAMHSLQATDSLSVQSATTALSSEPSSFVNNVNVIAGTFHQSHLDLTIPGLEALDLRHIYSSDSYFENWMGKAALSTNFSTRIMQSGLYGSGDQTLLVEGNQGAFLHYKTDSDSMHSKHRTYYVDPKIIHRGLSNTGSGQMSGRTNLKNSCFYFAKRISATGDVSAKLCARYGDGTYKRYEDLDIDKGSTFTLKYEKRPNRTRLRFKYDDWKELKNICLFDSSGIEPLAWLDFSYSESKEQATVRSSNSRFATYSFTEKKHPQFGKVKYVEKIESSGAPTVEFDYVELKDKAGYAISKVSYPNGRFLELAYDKKGRVISQEGPMGSLWNFYYHDFQTEALDALHHKTLYHYSRKDRLTIIDRYADKKLLRRERFFWGERSSIKPGEHDESDEGNLIGKALMNRDDKALASCTYEYDTNGNVTASTLFGNLTGANPEPFSIDDNGKPKRAPRESYTTHATYSNDGYNLLLTQTEEDGTRIGYSYKEKSNLLLAKFTYSNGRTAIREFFDYDRTGTLIEKIVDDGDSHDRNNMHAVTTRRITKIVPVERVGSHGACLPKVVTEYAYDPTLGKKLQQSRIEYVYNTQGQVTEEHHFDAANNHAFTLTSVYDSRGRLITSTDAIGRVFKFRYDANNNKTHEELVDSGYSTSFVYDTMNRLIEKTETHTNGEKFCEFYSYDAAGNKIAYRDSFGNQTHFQYDDLNRLIKTIAPKVRDEQGGLHHPTVARSYDEADNVISETNQNGATTTTSYNIRKQPIAIHYPDGSSCRFEYNLNGTLKHKFDKNGTCHSYEYDYQKRVTQEKISDKAGKPLTTTKNSYSAFQLLSTEDAMGYSTNYLYDAQGRLKELQRENKRTTYEYDALGRETVTKEWSGKEHYVATIREFDALNRVTKESQEYDDGTLLRKRAFHYDIFGNKTKVETYSEKWKYTTQETQYNSRGEPVCTIDELGARTTLFYDRAFFNRRGQNVLRVTSTDPLGQSTLTQYDALHRPVFIATYSKENLPLQRLFIGYDSVGNKTKETHEVFVDNKVDHTFIIVSKYDSQNRLIECTEQPGTQEEKTTRQGYSRDGFLDLIIKPDGVRLQHSYDAFGNLKTLVSSDKTIDYEYRYDKNMNPITVVDHVSHTTHTRVFDAHNKVTQDYDIALSYDNRQRLKRLTLPDGSSVRYKYTGGNLSDVIRDSPTQKELYRHSYTSFDLKDRVLKSSLIGKAGTAQYAYDKKDRCISTTSPHWFEEITSIDAADNIRSLTISDSIGYFEQSFGYDDLYQLTKENDHLYKHDSLHNRLKKDSDSSQFDSGNKLLQEGALQFTYDKNGNLLTRTENGATTHFRYDALNRLIEATLPTQFRVCYTYDSLHRRLSMQTFSWQTDRWKEENWLRFLYLAEREIGAIDSSNTLVQFRALGRGKGSDIGATVAIELNDAIYAPIHDHRGNICCLIDAATGQAAESIRYTAYGEETTSSSLSPWRFSSKRLEQKTRLIHFARRDYCPTTARWTTPDPVGFGDGPNLYAYVHNRPMLHIDPYGLAAIDQKASISSPPTTSIFAKYSTPDSSCIGEIGSWSLANGSAIIYVNGQNNTLSECISSATLLSEAGEGIKVIFVYNATHGPLADTFRSITFMQTAATPYASHLLTTQCEAQLATMQQDSSLLVVCHSQGTTVTSKSLNMLTEEETGQIEVAAFAPSKYISSSNCKAAMNYVSIRDIVPYCDSLLDSASRNLLSFGTPKPEDLGQPYCPPDCMRILQPHSDAPILDHSFSSPTYQESQSDRIREFIQENGGMP